MQLGLIVKLTRLVSLALLVSGVVLSIDFMYAVLPTVTALVVALLAVTVNLIVSL